MASMWINLYPGKDKSGWLCSQGTIEGEEPGRGNVTNRAGEKHAILKSQLFLVFFSLVYWDLLKFTVIEKGFN